jgi:outer membrane protein assembly factor BamB
MALIPWLLALPVGAGQWTDWRGPERDGRSPETGLPDRWSPAGENLAWKAPYGSRSTPVVLGDHLYLLTAVGAGPTRQERVVCLNADTGRLLWEHRFNVFLSDVPPHRVGWASPVVDPATGNVYAFGVGGSLLALTRDGKVLWERSLAEEFGLVTTHGGRTVSPVLEGDLVLVSGVAAGWGAQARASHRFFGFDRKTGETVYVSSPGGRPFDTTYSPPIATEVDGMRLLIAGGSDGAFHAIKPLTGEPVWKYEVSKRGVNTGAVVHRGQAIVTHSEENLDSSEMGLMAAVDVAARGDVTPAQVKWRHLGFQGGFSSPVVDGDRVYQVDNGANLAAFDATSGSQLWTTNLGTIQKASPVLADGKLYVGSENGRFFILKPGPTGATVLDEDQMGTEAAPEAIVASVAVAGGRVYLATMDALYAIGKKGAPHAAAAAKRAAAPGPAAASADPPAHVQVVPTELVLKPGDHARFRARLFDAKGRFLREEPGAAWSLDGLQGTVGADGTWTAAGAGQAGQVKATVGALSGAARVRVIPLPPQAFDFQQGAVPPEWINATGKFAVKEGTLVKLADNAATKRARVYMGPTDWSDYTVEADVLSREQRRQMGDGGVVAQRYQLALFGNHQRVELQSWQPETGRTVSLPFAWKSDTWYRLKLTVENRPDGTTRARGKVWPVAGPEPEAWTVERVDSQPNRHGSPGLYADAPVEVLFDNVSVRKNGTEAR